MERKQFTFKKGQYYSIDKIQSVLNIIGQVSHKPDDNDINVISQQRGDHSDYEIFDKKVRITIEIFD